MRQTIGIVLFSLILNAYGVESIDLQYHSAFFKEIEWSQLQTLAIDQVSLRAFYDDPDQGGLFFVNRHFRTIENRFSPAFIPVLNRKVTPRVVGWLIARKFNWIRKKEWFDKGFASPADTKLQRIEKIDLFNPEAVAAVIDTFADLAGSGVDGILIQDDLMLRSLEGFSDWGQAAYNVQTQHPVDLQRMVTPDTPEQQNWNRVKLNQLNQVVRRIVTACKKVNPDCQVAMNVYYETPLTVEHGEAWYAQNLNELMLNGLDEIVLMAYHRQMAQEWKLAVDSPLLRERFQTMLQQAQRICGDKLRIKMQIRDWQSGELLAVDELVSFLALADREPRRISLTPVRPGDVSWLQTLLAKLKRRGN